MKFSNFFTGNGAEALLGHVWGVQSYFPAPLPFWQPSILSLNRPVEKLLYYLFFYHRKCFIQKGHQFLSQKIQAQLYFVLYFFFLPIQFSVCGGEVRFSACPSNTYRVWLALFLAPRMHPSTHKKIVRMDTCTYRGSIYLLFSSLSLLSQSLWSGWVGRA